MRVTQTLRPGKRGTLRYVERFGERLVCVRYRYDDDRQRRVTTVEVVVDEKAWAPRAGTVVGLRVAWGEADVARRIKRVGGTWDAGQGVWRLAAGEARRLGLVDRMVRVTSHQMQRPSLHSQTGHSIQ